MMRTDHCIATRCADAPWATGLSEGMCLTLEFFQRASSIVLYRQQKAETDVMPSKSLD
jgi:hypothetical protein